MGQDFDKILRENLQAFFLPIIEKWIGFKIIAANPLPDKLPTTVLRETDTTQIITLSNQQKKILHLEFQTSDERKMVYRMAEYQAILQRKFNLPVLSYVIYLGEKPPVMRTQLEKEEIFTGFDLFNLKAMDYEALLHSQIPEEITLAILANYPEEQKEVIIRSIISRISQVASDQSLLQKYLKQLIGNVLTFSQLRTIPGKSLGKIA